MVRLVFIRAQEGSVSKTSRRRRTTSRLCDHAQRNQRGAKQGFLGSSNTRFGEICVTLDAGKGDSGMGLRRLHRQEKRNVNQFVLAFIGFLGDFVAGKGCLRSLERSVSGLETE